MTHRRAARRGHCDACGKGLWASRKHARAAAHRIHPGAALHVYPCPAGLDGFHYGHLPAAVVRGRITRGTAYPNQKRTA